tara:strand:+ start:711 stop:1034 length:324 start_codon:yes stop_codon:yes gene_type:complete
MAIDFNTYNFEQIKKWREAMRSLAPDGECLVNKKTGLTWLTPGVTQPTDDEVEAEIARLDTVYDNNAYQRSRKAEYPTVADQLDDIYHNGIDGWKTTIKVTKDKYPK